MRRILIDRARTKATEKRGGGYARLDVNCEDVAATIRPEEVLQLDEALEDLEKVDPEAAEVVRLRFFVGLTIAETATALDVSVRKVSRVWAFARAWLRCEIERSNSI